MSFWDNRPRIEGTWLDTLGDKQAPGNRAPLVRIHIKKDRKHQCFWNPPGLVGAPSPGVQVPNYEMYGPNHKYDSKHRNHVNYIFGYLGPSGFKKLSSAHNGNLYIESYVHF